ncbi:MAG: hypothetical protein J6Q30_07920 [Oscillospiraceae bacterium]|nr:hypothetical protein [Oscillospiraceae bacterium]
MGLKSKKTPYQGMWIILLIMALPSVVLTWVFYAVISTQQAHLPQEVNWASSKIFGCGCGVVFQLSCCLTGAFKKDVQAVKKRLKEFFANIVVSARLAFSCYWDDVKTLGLALWIDLAIIGLNAYVFVDAILDFMTLRGFI